VERVHNWGQWWLSWKLNVWVISLYNYLSRFFYGIYRFFAPTWRILGLPSLGLVFVSAGLGITLAKVIPWEATKDVTRTGFAWLGLIVGVYLVSVLAILFQGIGDRT